MAEANVGALRRGYEALNRGDLSVVLELIDRGMSSRLLVVEHVAMLLGMLVAMLLRPAEYSGAHAHGHLQHELAA